MGRLNFPPILTPEWWRFVEHQDMEQRLECDRLWRRAAVTGSPMGSSSISLIFPPSSSVLSSSSSSSSVPVSSSSAYSSGQLFCGSIPVPASFSVSGSGTGVKAGISWTGSISGSATNTAPCTWTGTSTTQTIWGAPASKTCTGAASITISLNPSTGVYTILIGSTGGGTFTPGSASSMPCPIPDHTGSPFYACSGNFVPNLSVTVS